MPRRHHFVPEFYLARFTRSGCKDDVLWVINLQSAERYSARPKRIATQKGYYELDIPEEDPELLEKELARLEGLFRSILQRIESERCLPTGEDFNTILNFVAYMAARVPTQREVIEDQYDQVGRMQLRLALQSEGRFESLKKEMLESGNDIVQDARYEEIREFVFDDDRYTIEVDQNTLIKHMLMNADIILPLLAKRSWSLLVATPDAGDLICSDCPVSLVWSSDMPDQSFWSPGWAMPSTEVTMPLSRRMAIIGRFDGVEEVVEIGRQGVAANRKSVV